MNLYYANNIKLEKTENFSILGKDINKIFYISKIKKPNTYNIKLSRPVTSNIPDPKKIICKDINLCFCKTPNYKNNVIKESYKSVKPKKREVEKSVFKLDEKNKKDKKKFFLFNKNIVKEQKHKKNNSLVRPVFAEECQKDKNIFKHKDNRLNPININIKNNFQVNSIFNNFISNDFQKNLVSINNNLKIPFINFTKIPFPRFENMPNSFNEDFFKDNEVKFQLSSNIGNFINFSRINPNISKKKEKFNISLGNSSSKETTIDKNKFVFLEGIKRKGRKSKNIRNLNIPSKHTKFSSDNMMRKVKNKIIESSRLLCNKVISNEIQNLKDLFQFPYIEFKKIKGSFSQELNIKFNLWFYQIKIKEIFSMEISSKYSSYEKSSNIELIEYIFSKENIKNFPKTKELLNMPFHQYYHDIFLAERKDWAKYFDIKPEENKYELNYLLKSLEEEDKNNNLNKIYIEKICDLAKNYEGFFLYKKMRNVDLSDKKNDFIKQFMNNSLESDYFKYCEQVKKIKDFYNNRKNSLNENKNDEIKNKTKNNIINNFNKELIEEMKNDTQNEDIFKDIIISINEGKNQFLEKKRKPDKLLKFN